MIWRGVDLVALGMVLFLALNVLYGAYHIYNESKKSISAGMLWVGYALISGFFLWKILEEVT